MHLCSIYMLHLKSFVDRRRSVLFLSRTCNDNLGNLSPLLSFQINEATPKSSTSRGRGHRGWRGGGGFGYSGYGYGGGGGYGGRGYGGRGGGYPSQPGYG